MPPQDSTGRPPTCSRACSSSDRHHLPQGVDRHPQEPVPDPDAGEPFGPAGRLESTGQLVGGRSPDTEELRRLGNGQQRDLRRRWAASRPAHRCLPSRRWSWVLIVILPAVCPVRRERAVQLFWTDRLFSHQQIGAGVACPLSSSTSPPTSPSDISPASPTSPSGSSGLTATSPSGSSGLTNVTLGLQRADGNVTLAGQSSVGVSEKAPQAGDRLPGPHQHFPRHRAGGNAVPRPCSAGSVWGRTPCRVATHDGSRSSHRSADRERRPGGHRARLGARVTQHIGSAKAVRNRSTPVHSSAGTSP